MFLSSGYLHDRYVILHIKALYKIVSWGALSVAEQSW